MERAVDAMPVVVHQVKAIQSVFGPPAARRANPETRHQNRVKTGFQVPQGVRGRELVVVTTQQPKAWRDISATC
jgi:hypothetical protein